jgi:Ni,Fe-hydrogenase III large subunit
MLAKLFDIFVSGPSEANIKALKKIVYGGTDVADIKISEMIS